MWSKECKKTLLPGSPLKEKPFVNTLASEKDIIDKQIE